MTWNSLSRVGEACHTRINSARKLCPCFVSTSVAGAIHLLCRPGAEPSILLPQGMGHWQMKAMHCSWCLSPTVLWQCFCSHSIVQAGNGRGHRHEQGSTLLIGNVCAGQPTCMVLVCITCMQLRTMCCWQGGGHKPKTGGLTLSLNRQGGRGSRAKQPQTARAGGVQQAFRRVHIRA